MEADVEAELSKHHLAAFGWALACCGRDPNLAADVLQQSYVKVLSGGARFGGQSTFKTWFFGVVRLTAMESQRRRWLWPSGAPPPSEVLVPSPDSVPVDEQTAARLAAALARLPERQRQVMHLVFYEDLTVAEAAAVMQVALGTARQHYERGKANLATMLREDGVSLP